MSAKKPVPVFASFNAAGVAMAEAELKIGSVAQFLTTTLGVKPKYDIYTAARSEFVAAYALQAACKPDTAGKAWTRAKDRAGIEAPTAPSPAATRKAGERAKNDAKVAEIVKASGGDVAKIKAALPADAGPAVVKLYADAMLSADKVRQTAAKAKAAKLIDAMRKRLPTMNVEQLEMLARAADMICAGKALQFK